MRCTCRKKIITNLAHAVSVVRKYMVNPGQTHHWEALKWVLRYLRGTILSGLVYIQSTLDRAAIEWYVNANYVGNVDTRKPLSSMSLPCFGTVVCWSIFQLRKREVEIGSSSMIRSEGGEL